MVGSDFIQYEPLVPAIKVASGLDNIGTPVQAKDALADPAFKVPYTTASKAWRGGGSGWFDNIMSNITEVKLSIKRNRWSGYAVKGLGAANRAFKEIADEAEKLKKLSIDNGISKTRQYRGENGTIYQATEGFYIKTEGDTQWIYKDDTKIAKISDIEPDLPDSDDIPGISSTTNPVARKEGEDRISDVLNSRAIAVGQAVSNVACGVAEALATIHTLASAYQSLQFLNLVSGFL